tara:strand:- start:596 stop:850 length:255 start_codon:yes stop_codon:yes gene_type:complete
MPYHKDYAILKTKEDISKEKKERKPSKMSFFESVKISKEDQNKLKMMEKKQSKTHVTNMKKLLKKGKTFSQAHKAASILDKKRK